MNRRKALKQLGILASGITLLPSCDLSSENIVRVRNKFKVTETQDELMKSLVESIIPETDSPGGLSLELDDFVWVMIDDCLEEDVQAVCLKGLKEFEQGIERLTGKKFASSDKKERIQALENLAEADSTEEIEASFVFLQVVKGFSILGYQRSSYVMTELMPYALVPGKAPICKTVQPNESINING